MIKRKSIWPLLALLVCIAAIIGIGIALNMVRAEGWDELLNRKKNFIEDVRPGSKEFLDEADKRVRRHVPDGY